MKRIFIFALSLSLAALLSACKEKPAPAKPTQPQAVQPAKPAQPAQAAAPQTAPKPSADTLDMNELAAHLPQLDKAQTMGMFDLYKKIITAQRAYYKAHGAYADTFVKMGVTIPVNIVSCGAPEDGVKDMPGGMDCLKIKGDEYMMGGSIILVTVYSTYGLTFNGGIDFSLTNGASAYGSADIQCQALTSAGENFCAAFGGQRDPAKDTPPDIMASKAYKITF